MKRTQKTGSKATNSVYVSITCEEVNRSSVLLRNFMLKRKESDFNPLLHIHMEH